MTRTKSVLGLSLASLMLLLACKEAARSSGTGGGGSTSGDGDAMGQPGGGSGGDGGPITSDVPRQVIEPPTSDTFLRNPERGFYRSVDLISDASLAWVDDEYSLYHSYVRLDDYRDTEIPASFLDEIDVGFDKLRAEGAKVILRFSYNFGPYPDSEPDASLEQILEHIEQLTPVLRDNVDVIATMQAGFIGAWGEWHTSTNGLDNPEDKRAVLDALLNALPSSRTVQIRYPANLFTFFGTDPLDIESAWQPTAQARTGHHNDCFLASDTDLGTYPGPEDPESYKAFLEPITQFVPMGGETCGVNPPRSECTVALEEMQRLHFSYVNSSFHPDVIAAWESEGCRSEMDRSLGYRLHASKVDLPQSVAPGDEFTAAVTLTNLGWAAPINPRRVFLVLRLAGEVYRLQGKVEVRSLLAGSSTPLIFRGILPGGVAEGTAKLGLWMPDDDTTLAQDSRYSIRLAQQTGWDATTGVNDLAELTVDAAAPRDNVAGAEPMESGFQ